MKKWVLDHFEDMTEEEIISIQETQSRYEAEMNNQEPTLEDRIAALEEELILSKILLGVDN